MLEVQREAIVADANAASTGLIYRELQCLQYYLGTIGTQSALVGGFSVGLFNLDVFPDGDSIDSAIESSYYLFASVSAGALLWTVIATSLVSSRAATMGLTGVTVSSMRQAVIMMKQDQRLIDLTFYTGIVTFLLAMFALLQARQIEVWLRVLCCVVFGASLLGIICFARRTQQRYKHSLVVSAVVSGDEFVRMGRRGTASRTQHVTSDSL